MFTDSLQRDVQRHREKITSLQKDKAGEASRVADARKRAVSEKQSASRSSNLSSVKSYLTNAARYENDAVRYEQSVADYESRIAREHQDLARAEEKLARAKQNEAERAERERKNRDSQQQNNLRTINVKLANHQRMHNTANLAIRQLVQPKKKITVLFLASNPIDQNNLRLDEEVRAIGEMIRKSEHRDSVVLESRWAVRPLDVLQAINECNPSIVHFSGHGSPNNEIVFQDEMGNAKLVSKEAIVQTIAAGSNVQLVYFNTCFSRDQAELCVKSVRAAIGMSTAIGDEAARIFAAQFYSAIGFGKHLSQAFSQAKAALALEGIPEEDTPELFVASDSNAEDIILVEPKQNND